MNMLCKPVPAVYTGAQSRRCGNRAEGVAQQIWVLLTMMLVGSPQGSYQPSWTGQLLRAALRAPGASSPCKPWWEQALGHQKVWPEDRPCMVDAICLPVSMFLGLGPPIKRQNLFSPAPDLLWPIGRSRRGCARVYSLGQRWPWSFLLFSWNPAQPV